MMFAGNEPFLMVISPTTAATAAAAVFCIYSQLFNHVIMMRALRLITCEVDYIITVMMCTRSSITAGAAWECVHDYRSVVVQLVQFVPAHNM